MTRSSRIARLSGRVGATCGATPLSGAPLAPALARSMAWMLEAGGAPAHRPVDLLRVKLLAGIHLSVMRVWLRDDSEDLGRTMASLDKALKRWAPMLEGRRC